MAKTTEKDILLATTYPRGYAADGDTWVKVFVTVRAYKVERFSVQARHNGRHYASSLYFPSLGQATEMEAELIAALTRMVEEREEERNSTSQPTPASARVNL